MQQATFAYRATKQQLRYVENKITFDKVKHVNNSNTESVKNPICTSTVYPYISLSC